VGEDQKIFTDYQKLATLYQSKIGELFARRTGTHTTRWWARYIYSGRDRFLSPDECLKLSLVDEVCAFEACYTPAEA
jgi:ATP-dependent protease ClpP protease subunit